MYDQGNWKLHIPLIDAKNSVWVVAVFANPVKLDWVPPLLCQIFIWEYNTPHIRSASRKTLSLKRRKGQESVSPNSLSGDCFLLNSCSTSPVGSARLPRTHLIVLSWANWTEVTSQRSAGLSASLPSSPNPAHTAWPSAGQRFIFWVSGRPWVGQVNDFQMPLELGLKDLY